MLDLRGFERLFTMKYSCKCKNRYKKEPSVALFGECVEVECEREGEDFEKNEGDVWME